MDNLDTLIKEHIDWLNKNNHVINGINYCFMHNGEMIEIKKIKGIWKY